LGETEESTALSEKEKQNLLQELKKDKKLLKDLEWKKARLKAFSRAAESRIKEIYSDLKGAQREIEDLNSKISVLKAESISLKEQNKKLSLENQDLLKRIGSKNAFNKAKDRFGREFWKAFMIRKPSEDKQLYGNRGFLLKDGKSTCATAIDIKITPIKESNNGKRDF
jgi:regulator of replication initiation timing